MAAVNPAPSASDIRLSPTGAEMWVRVRTEACAAALVVQPVVRAGAVLEVEAVGCSRVRPVRAFSPSLTGGML